jgi:hypothetical protein
MRLIVLRPPLHRVAPSSGLTDELTDHRRLLSFPWSRICRSSCWYRLLRHARVACCSPVAPARATMPTAASYVHDSALRLKRPPTRPAVRLTPTMLPNRLAAGGSCRRPPRPRKPGRPSQAAASRGNRFHGSCQGAGAGSEPQLQTRAPLPFPSFPTRPPPGPPACGRSVRPLRGRSRLARPADVLEQLMGAGRAGAVVLHRVAEEGMSARGMPGSKPPPLPAPAGIRVVLVA